MGRKPTRTQPGGLVGVGLADMADACRDASARIDIATPFLSAEVAGYLVRACDDGRARDRRFITALNSAAVEGGYLDPDAVEELISAGFKARSLRNLHAKVLIADSTWAMIGSGNLTAAGANGGNAELGIVLTPEQSRIAQRKHFDIWWAHAEPLDISWMRELKRKAPPSPQRRRRQGRGGLLPASSGVDLGGFSANRHDSGYWLKILYATDGRMTARYWQRRMWISDRHTAPRADGVPGRKPSYRVGEHLVVYVSRGPRQACPAVMRVAEPPVFDPDLVEREVNAEDAALWGWVTWVEPVAAVALSRAPTLADVGVSPRSVRRHGHIRLSRDQYRRALRGIRGW